MVTERIGNDSCDITKKTFGLLQDLKKHIHNEYYLLNMKT